jgi:hypothetical protein
MRQLCAPCSIQKSLQHARPGMAASRLRVATEATDPSCLAQPILEPCGEGFEPSRISRRTRAIGLGHHPQNRGHTLCLFGVGLRKTAHDSSPVITPHWSLCVELCDDPGGARAERHADADFLGRRCDFCDPADGPRLQPSLPEACWACQPEPHADGCRRERRLVSRLGIEPRTRRLRVCCSAN